MASNVVMPKLGNTVDSCIILDWKVREGDTVSQGDVLCEAETDKSTVEVESTASGVVLQILYGPGEEVPVMQPIAIIGEKGEQFVLSETASAKQEEQEKETVQKQSKPVVDRMPSKSAVSPRARKTAQEKAIDIASLDIQGSGAKGRVIERDVLAAVQSGVRLTPAARQVVAESGLNVPTQGTGIGGRILVSDVLAQNKPIQKTDEEFPGPYVETYLKGVRKVTAKRMHESIATTAQLTIHAYARATALQTLRSRFKQSDERWALKNVTINDMLLFAVSRTLLRFPALNSHFLGDRLVSFDHVHLGCAVDTEKGLYVPVIRYADTRTLRSLSEETKRLASLCNEGKAGPEQLSGGTFTVTNLGPFGVESFTPIVNIPEVAILGIGTITMRPIMGDNDEVSFVPHIGLSLTIDHQAVDGAPAARFLSSLCEAIASFDLLLAQ